MKPQSVPPWDKETTGTSTRYAALPRAIRANKNRARHARDSEERDYYLAQAKKLKAQLRKLTGGPS